MKKLTILLFLALILSGCGRAAPTMAAVHSALTMDGTRIALDAPAAPVLEALGVPCGYAESSGKTGLLKTYRFPGLELNTYPGTDGERIRGIRITGTAMKTPEGITVGTHARQVQEYLGLDTLPESACVLTRNAETMTVTIRNHVVTQIQYVLA